MVTKYPGFTAGFNGTALPALQMELTHANETVTLWQSPESSVYAWRKLVAYPGRVPGEFQVRSSPPSLCLPGPCQQRQGHLVLVACDVPHNGSHKRWSQRCCRCFWFWR